MADRTGLDQLDARRKRVERRVPTPRHTKAPVVAAPEAAVADLELAAVPAASETPSAALETPPVAPVVTPPSVVSPTSAVGRQGKTRSRQTQVLFDARADAHLNALKKHAVMADVSLSTSAVLRQALEEYVEARGYDGIVTWFAEHGR